MRELFDSSCIYDNNLIFRLLYFLFFSEIFIMEIHISYIIFRYRVEFLSLPHFVAVKCFNLQI